MCEVKYVQYDTRGTEQTEPYHGGCEGPRTEGTNRGGRGEDRHDRKSLAQKNYSWKTRGQGGKERLSRLTGERRKEEMVF